MLEEEEKVDTSLNNKNNTLPTSMKSKMIIKLRLKQILKEMDKQYLLSSFCEDLDYETKGKFNFLELKEIIDKKYPELNIDKKMFLLKYIPLTSIGVNQKTPYITIINLFNFLEKILEEKIISPSLILYKTAQTLKNKFHISPSEFIYSIGLYTTSIINLREFYTKIATKLNLDDIDCMVIFKGLDYKNCGKIKMNDFILVLKSFSEEGYEIFNALNEKKMKDEEKSARIMKMFLDKNNINLDKFFDDVNVNYMEYTEIKKLFMKELSNNQNNFEKKEPITEKIIDDVLISVSRNYKIFKDDLENFLNNAKRDSIHNYIKLNEIQKHWISQFIKALESINITPKMIFESSSQLHSPDLIYLEDLKRQLHILFPGGKISIPELNNMMDALNINNNKTIEKKQYEQIIKQIQKQEEINNENENKEKNDEFINQETKKNFKLGIKSTIYHLLPVKGNHDILLELNKDINENLLLQPKKDSGEIKEEKEKKNFNFDEEENMEGNKAPMGQISEKSNISEKYVLKRKNELNIEGEYIDRHKIIELFENFTHYNLIFPSYNLMQYLINNEISKQKSFEIIKYLDSDKDGYISFLQIINFILKELTFRSTKLLYKYLYLKIYKDFGFPTSEEFFTRYNFSIYDIININDLAKFYLALNIEIPLTMKSYEELRNIFKPPLIYKHICKLIDVYKYDDKINNLEYFEEKKEEEKQYVIPIINFDLQMKNLIYRLLDKKDMKKDNYTKAIHIRQKLKKILKNCVEKMNLSQYNLFFAKPLNIEPILATTIFQLLKIIMPNGEQLLDKNDLLMLLESYSSTDGNNNSVINNQSDDKIIQIKNLVDYIENNSPPMKYAFEIIPFRRNGMIASTEMLIYLQNFYKNIPKNDLMKIIKHLDTYKLGYIDYTQIQMFLYNFSSSDKFSINIELKLIASNISKTGVINASEYFMKDEFKDLIKSYDKISKKEHNILFNDLCSSNKNKKELYEYLINISEGKTYDIKYISDIIDGFLELDYYDPKKIEKAKIQEISLIEGKLPKKEIFEKALQNINLGDKGYIFMNEILRQIPKSSQITIRNKFDKDKIGFISFPDFIKISREIYGTEINLNYKLCAQYIYKCFIKSPEKIQSYLLQRINETNILIYLTYEMAYNNFMFAFVNDKFLFEEFFNTYKEKKGEHQNMLKLHSLQQFILYNNPELKSYPKIDFIPANKDMINSQDYDSINNLLRKKLISIREIIDMININECDLLKDFGIKENYMRDILNKNFDYLNDDIDIFCNYFRFQNDNIKTKAYNTNMRFNLQKFFCFDKEIQNNINIIIIEEIIPKIKEQIVNNDINNYHQYKLKYFKSDLLTITEVFDIFNSLYNLTLFQCLCIINDEQYLSIEKFFDEFDLKDLFQEKEYEPVLKTAIMKLNKYFEEHKDKLKLFKEIDLDKNGILSNEEFMTLLNSLEDLNLEDNQKYKLLLIADKNKDGKIKSKEFLNFIKSARYLSDKNSINNMTSTYPNINKNIAIQNTNFIPRYLEDKSLVEKNLEINKSLYKPRNGFLNTIIILQEDIVENFFNFDCIEQDFTIADTDKSGKVVYFKFNSILKKRLFKLKDNNFNRMIEFANEGLDEDIQNELNENKVIDYKNFLLNLVNYNEQGKNKRDWEEDPIIEEENKEENKAIEDNKDNTDNNEQKTKEEKKQEELGKDKEIDIGGKIIEEQQVEKNEENEYDKFYNDEILKSEENKEKNDENNNKIKESEIMEESSKKDEDKNNEKQSEIEMKKSSEKEIEKEEEKEIIDEKRSEIEEDRIKKESEEKIENEIETGRNEENEMIKKEVDNKSEETKGVVNEGNEEEYKEDNNLGIKLGNNAVEETRIMKE